MSNFILDLIALCVGINIDSTYIQYDSYVKEFCEVSFRFEPKQIINTNQSVKSICLTQFGVKTHKRDTIYICYEGEFSPFYEKNNDYNIYHLGALFHDVPILYWSDDMYQDGYLFKTFLSLAMQYYKVIANTEKEMSHTIRFAVFPKKIKHSTRKSLYLVSDSLSHEGFVKKHRLDLVSSKFETESRKRVISCLDYRFERADSVFFLELCDKDIFYWSYVYSPDIDIIQPWYILKKTGKLIKRHMFKGCNSEMIRDVILSQKSALNKEEHGGFSNFFNVLLIVKNKDGQYKVEYYKKTKKNIGLFLDNRGVINL